MTVTCLISFEAMPSNSCILSEHIVQNQNPSRDQKKAPSFTHCITRRNAVKLLTTRFKFTDFLALKGDTAKNLAVQKLPFVNN